MNFRFQRGRGKEGGGFMKSESQEEMEKIKSGCRKEASAASAAGGYSRGGE